MEGFRRNDKLNFLLNLNRSQNILLVIFYIFNSLQKLFLKITGHYWLYMLLSLPKKGVKWRHAFGGNTEQEELIRNHCSTQRSRKHHAHNLRLPPSGSDLFRYKHNPSGLSFDALGSGSPYFVQRPQASIPPKAGWWQSLKPLIFAKPFVS